MVFSRAGGSSRGSCAARYGVKRKFVDVIVQRRDLWARLTRMRRGPWGLAVKAKEVCRQATFDWMRRQAEELAMQIEKGDPGGRVESSQESDRQEERIHIVASAMRRAPSPWLPRGSGATAASDVDEEVALQVGSNVQVLVCGLARRHQES